MIQSLCGGFGSVGLAGLLAGPQARAAAMGRYAGPALPVRAKHVICLFMTGGPSHLEPFDPKPALTKLNGQPLPPSFNAQGLPLQFMKATDGKLMASPFAFRKHGLSGLEISALFPNLARHADRLAVVRSCWHESFIHGPAITLQTTGSLLLGHPSVGAWVTYGLGCESDNLPAYVVLSDGGFRGGNVMYQSGFLPAVYQGTVLREEGAPIQNLTPPAALGRQEQRQILDQVRRWNERHRRDRPGDSRLDARVANYELAYRMQTAAPGLIDLSGEAPAVTWKSRGAEVVGRPRSPISRASLRRFLSRRARMCSSREKVILSTVATASCTSHLHQWKWKMC